MVRSAGSAHRTVNTALSRALRDRGLPTTGLASRVEDTVHSGREASAVLLEGKVGAELASAGLWNRNCFAPEPPE